MLAIVTRAQFMVEINSVFLWSSRWPVLRDYLWSFALGFQANRIHSINISRWSRISPKLINLWSVTEATIAPWENHTFLAEAFSAFKFSSSKFSRKMWNVHTHGIGVPGKERHLRNWIFKKYQSVLLCKASLGRSKTLDNVLYSPRVLPASIQTCYERYRNCKLPKDVAG